MFEWDEKKSERCLIERGFDFNIVYEFNFETAIIKLDDRFDYGEIRYCAMNKIDGKLYAVVFTRRQVNVKIISVRRATDKEGLKYGLQD